MIFKSLILIAGSLWLAGPATTPAQDLAGLWDVSIVCKGGDIRFGLDLQRSDANWNAWIVNGTERIAVPKVIVKPDTLTLDIVHYDSQLTLNLDPKDDSKALAGIWKKRRGPNKWLTMNCNAIRHVARKSDPPNDFLGRWSVKFESSDDPAVAIIEQAKNSNAVGGTFLTTTGDYRFLAGHVDGETLELSCFDGAHAFLFRARLENDRTLKGDFWSSSAWHETWTAKPDANAQLPDEFKQTTVAEDVDWGALAFPDLGGHLTKLDDPKFAGQARIIYVFGSWCPNCHDAGKYFSELEKEYGPKGLSILGLAFELTGDFERDSTQVKKYLDRHDSNYPVLIAGMADKAEASKALPILDRVRSYPTTIFLDGEGKVTAVHTGFTGPATGEAFENLKRKFELQIKQNLGEK